MGNKRQRKVKLKSGGLNAPTSAEAAAPAPDLAKTPLFSINEFLPQGVTLEAMAHRDRPTKWKKLQLLVECGTPILSLLTTGAFSWMTYKVIRAQESLQERALSDTARQFEMELAIDEASQMYDEIRATLHDPNAPSQAQIYALKRIPEAWSCYYVAKKEIKKNPPHSQTPKRQRSLSN